MAQPSRHPTRDWAKALAFTLLPLVFVGVAYEELRRGAHELLEYEETVGEVTQFFAPNPRRVEGAVPADGLLQYIYRVDGRVLEGRYPPNYWMAMPRLPHTLLESPHTQGEPLRV